MSSYLMVVSLFILQITDMKDVERDMLLSVSSSKTFQRPSESSHNVAMKATWGRTRKQHGPESTDIVVRSDHNPNVDVRGLIFKAI